METTGVASAHTHFNFFFKTSIHVYFFIYFFYIRMHTLLRQRGIYTRDVLGQFQQETRREFNIGSSYT